MNAERKLTGRTFEIADRLMEGVKTLQILKEFSEKWQCSERTVEYEISFARKRIINLYRNTRLLEDTLRTESQEADPDKPFNVKDMEGELWKITLGRATNERLVKLRSGKTKIELLRVTITDRIKAMNALLRIFDKNNAPMHKFTPIKGNSENYSPEKGYTIVVRNEAEKRAVEMV